MAFLIVAMTLFFIIKNNINLLIYFYIFLAVGIPSNNNIKQSLFIVIKGIDFTLFPLVSSFLLILFTNCINRRELLLNKKSLSLIGLLIFITFYSFLGFINQNNYLNNDLISYYSILTTYFIFSILFNIKNKYKVLKVFLVASLFYSLVIIYIYYFARNSLDWIYGEDLFLWWGDRVGFGNTSVLLISFFLSLYLLLNKKDKFFNFIVCATNIAAILISQNLSITLILIINIFVYFLLNTVKDMKALNVSVKGIINLCFLGILLALMILTINQGWLKQYSDVGVLGRFNNLEVGENSLSVRNVSNNIALKDIFKEPGGFGLGKELVLYDSNGSYVKEGLYVDNFFITVMMKTGVIGFFVILTVLLGIEYYIVKLYIKTKQTVNLFAAFLFPSFIILTAYLNAHLLYSLPVMVVFVLFIVWVNIQNEIVINEKNV